MTMRRRGAAAFFLAALVAAAPAGAQAPADRPADRVVVMATGDVAGAYFPAGVALCRVVNETRAAHGLRCTAQPSEGSVGNIAALRAGDVELAIVQSDVADAALKGVGAFAGAGPFPELRAIAALFPEPLTLVARAGSGITGLGDLAGKRVSIGPAGSGQRALIAGLTERLGWREGAFEAAELAPAEAVAALCDGRIDAFFYAVGHPALAVAEATSGCGATLVPLQGPEVDALIAANSLAFAAEIPAGTYQGAPAATPTLGVGAVLVTRADVPAADVQIVTGAILDNLSDLAGFAPILAGLDPRAMPRRGVTAPLHPGAEAAYAARGLLD